MTSDQPATAAIPDDVTLNRLAQRFYEASGIHVHSMTDKPLIVKGLRAVFQALADGTEDDDAIPMRSQP